MSAHVLSGDGVRLRAGPGEEYEILRKLGIGTRVERLGASDDGRWVYVREPAGWLSAGYLAPAPPAKPKPLSDAERQRTFGKIEFVRAPTASNPEAITITNDFARENIVACVIPQLRGIPGAPADGKIWLHRKVKQQVLDLFAAWERAGLLSRIKTWDGMYNPRLVRGSTTSLSNHSFGTALDINAAWNGLGKTPAAVGAVGSVRELVPIAEAHGFFWGANFSRPDGMHFEVARLL